MVMDYYIAVLTIYNNKISLEMRKSNYYLTFDFQWRENKKNKVQHVYYVLITYCDTECCIKPQTSNIHVGKWPFLSRVPVIRSERHKSFGYNLEKQVQCHSSHWQN